MVKKHIMRMKNMPMMMDKELQIINEVAKEPTLDLVAERLNANSKTINSRLVAIARKVNIKKLKDVRRLMVNEMNTRNDTLYIQR
jgi:DNA-binding CsgD family transcriptional regulator